MRKIDLAIGGRKVELDDNALILFTYTMEDLYDPVVVKNSYSKQITIKGTPGNNKLFGDIFRSDRRTLYGSGYTRTLFDALRKTPFNIYNELGNILESGYAKLDSVAREGNEVTYKVSLYGELGSFFYSLTYGEGGEKRTLNDLAWKHYNGQYGAIQPYQLTKDVLVNKAWKYLEQGDTYLSSNPSESWDILNYAPAYNGLPSDFDANKVLDNGILGHSGITEDGKYYADKSGCSTHLIKLSESLTEWEMKNIRPYLQRPVVRVSAIIDAIVNEARSMGYKIELDSIFFHPSNVMYYKSWITLPLIATKHRNSSDVVSAILSSSLTPCDYLLMIAKMCGLIFTYDMSGKTIKLQTRNNFYNGEVIDIEERIDHSGLTITPYNVQSKYYQLGGDKVVGEEAKKYKEQNEREYAVQLINTGYEFNAEIQSLTKSIPATNAADVIESNSAFSLYWYYKESTGSYADIHPLFLHDSPKMELYEGKNKKEFTLTEAKMIPLLLDSSHPYEDWFPKVQFHDEDNKSSQGEHCFLLFDGIKTAPRLSPPGTLSAARDYAIYVSDDHPDMAILNSEKPCWSLANAITTTKLPSFRRSVGNYTMEWGKPLESFTHDNWNDINTLYERYWKQYLTDRYNVDSRKMRCKVNLRGMQVGQDLMRNLFYYDNAIWVLNKIDNHSITTDDLTDCEFIKVMDKSNYTLGQKL